MNAGVVNAGVAGYLLMIPIATVLLMWDWARRGIEPDFGWALIMAMWWPLVFCAVLAAVYEEE